MKNKKKDIIILGLALFAMFFGAGNLIFPPYLGLGAGSSWIFCGIGFFLTAIGMPLLGIIAAAKSNGDIQTLCNKIHPTFSKYFTIIIVLALGPFLAIPRTGATTFEMGTSLLFPNISPFFSSIIFFLITLFLTIKPSKIIDNIGKILTPSLLIIVSLIIYKGVISPLGITHSIMSNPVKKGFTEGYQTMDALASLLLGGVLISSIKSKGYKEGPECISITSTAGMLAALGLLLVYGGLMYLGSTCNDLYDINIPKTLLLINITHGLLGSIGKVLLGIMVSLACLTTSVGLTATVGKIFSSMSKDKIKYEQIVIVTCIFSMIMSNFGVEKIVKISIPLLVLLYPIAIVLILSNSIYIIPSYAQRGAVLATLIFSSIDTLSSFNIKMSFIENITLSLPFSDLGIGWLLPAITGALIWTIIYKAKKVPVLR